MPSRTAKLGSRVLAGGIVALGLIVPASALASTSHEHSYKTQLTHEIAAAHTAVATVKKDAIDHVKVTRTALKTARTDAWKAAEDAVKLGKSSKTEEAGALVKVAQLLKSESGTFTGLVPGAPSGDAGSLGGAVTSTVTGETDVLGVIDSLLGSLPTATAQSILGDIQSLLNSASSELGTLSTDVGSGDFTGGLQSILSTALTTASGEVDAIIAQLETVVSDLPAADQASAEQFLTMIKSFFASLTTTLGNVSTSTGVSTGTGDQLGGIASWLQQLLGMITGSGQINWSFGSGSGSGTGSSSGFPFGGSSSNPLSGLITLLGDIGITLPPGL